MVVLILLGFPPRAERRSPRKLLGQLPALLRAAEIQAGNNRENEMLAPGVAESPIGLGELAKGRDKRLLCHGTEIPQRRFGKT